MMNVRLPLLLLLAAAPLRAADTPAGLSDFESSLEKAMQDSDSASYGKMRKECDAKPGAERIKCLREHLAKFTEAYEARVKDAKVDPKKGLVGNLDPLEQMLIGQVAMSNPAFKEKWAKDKEAAAKDPKEVPGFVAGYRSQITGLTSGYRAKPAESTRSSMGTQLLGAKKQVEAAVINPEGVIEGNTRKPGGVTTPAVGTGDGKKKKKGDKEEDPSAVVNAESKTPTPSETKAPPAPGDLKAEPVPKADDPNRWNDTIAGAKGALYGALLGFIFGGPMGMFVFGMVGFAAMYGISKMNNS